MKFYSIIETWSNKIIFEGHKNEVIDFLIQHNDYSDLTIVQIKPVSKRFARKIATSQL
jgi:hypothetical protein